MSPNVLNGPEMATVMIVIRETTCENIASIAVDGVLPGEITSKIG